MRLLVAHPAGGGRGIHGTWWWAAGAAEGSRPNQLRDNVNIMYIYIMCICIYSCLSGRHKPQSFCWHQNIALLQPWCKNLYKNQPQHGPKNGTAWRSHFLDRMHSLVKEQKKSIFTVPFLGPSGGTKNETAKSQNQQQRPTRPNKNTTAFI